jgi:hypothetical protein
MSETRGTYKVGKLSARALLLAMTAAIVGALQREAAGLLDLDEPANRQALAESIIEDARRLCDDECREP